jgi:hypothetical protein
MLLNLSACESEASAPCRECEVRYPGGNARSISVSHLQRSQMQVTHGMRACVILQDNWDHPN